MVLWCVGMALIVVPHLFLRARYLRQLLRLMSLQRVPATVTIFNPTPGGGVSNSQTFTINVLVPDNPVPALSSLFPAAAAAGSGAFTLTVNGSDFVANSVVRWNGMARSTTFVSSNQLTATVAGVDISTIGTASVTVFNPLPGGGASNAATFMITDPTPPGNPIPAMVSFKPERLECRWRWLRTDYHR